MNQLVLEVSKLSKSYVGNDNPALQAFSMEMAAGEIVGVLGANGAGKTTLMSIISGLLQADGGEVRIFDHLVKRTQLHSIHKMTGFVPQDIALYPQLTVYQNLRFFYHMYQLPVAKLDEQVSYWLGRFDLQDKWDASVESLSGGMQRKVNMISALLHAPQLLIMDEPAAGVDVHSRHQIYEMIREFKQKGISLLYTSHYLQEAQELCDRVYILEKGRLIEQGAPRELLLRYQVSNLDELFMSMTGHDIRDENL